MAACRQMHVLPLQPITTHNKLDFPPQRCRVVVFSVKIQRLMMDVDREHGGGTGSARRCREQPFRAYLRYHSSQHDYRFHGCGFFRFNKILILFVKACPMHVDRARTHAAVEAVSAVAAAEQQEGWRFVPDTILPGYQWAPQWVPARTPTVHWGPISGKAVGGPNSVQHNRSQCKKHPKYGSGATSMPGQERWQQEHC